MYVSAHCAGNDKQPQYVICLFVDLCYILDKVRLFPLNQQAILCTHVQLVLMQKLHISTNLTITQNHRYLVLLYAWYLHVESI